MQRTKEAFSSGPPKSDVVLIIVPMIETRGQALIPRDCGFCHANWRKPLNGLWVAMIAGKYAVFDV
jgi:hypothetical protein